MAKRSQQYSEEQIRVLEGLEAVRRRPGMYVGGTDLTGLHHLLWEVVDNSVDEAMAGRCENIVVSLHPDGSAEVVDDGSGIPVYWKTDQDKATLEVVFTQLHAGGKFDEGAYKASGGLHGVGVKATNALSEWLEVEVCRDGLRFRQRFERGIPAGTGKILGPDAKTESGTLTSRHTAYAKLPREVKRHADRKGLTTQTRIRFKPDGEVMNAVKFDRPLVNGRLRLTSFLIPAKIRLEDRRRKKVFRQEYTGEHKSYTGLSGLVSFLNASAGRTPLSANRTPIFIKDKFEVEHVGEVFLEVVIQYTDDPGGEIISFANTIPTKHGGEHVKGVRTALSRALTQWGRKRKKIKSDQSIAGVDTLFGLTLAVHVLVPEPQFTSQTKDELTSPISGAVTSSVYAGLMKQFDKNSKLAQAIIQMCMAAAVERKATAQARKLVARRSAMLEVGPDLSKLADVTAEGVEGTGLYIVEGDSAGGSAKQARDRKLHAVLPLRGKPLNTERAKMTRILSNKEFRAIIAAIGAGIGRDFNLEEMRYDRVVIFADADVDGGHISTLLLTFFFRHMRPLIESGRLWLARAPLYRLQKGRETVYVRDEEGLESALKKLGRSGLHISRFKGLGEMSPSEMRETVLNPGMEKRDGSEFSSILNPYHVQVTLEDAHAAAALISRLMGRSVSPRREWILQTWSDVEDFANGG
jgi:DNA gyrase subunit B